MPRTNVRISENRSTRVTEVASTTGAVHHFGQGYRRAYIDPKCQFRLLSIRAGENTDRIECSVETHDLGSAPFYRALSYVWGRGYQKTIYLGHYTFKVGSNLYGVLKHIAYMKHQGKPGWNGRWWIDAICIDQDDNLEKREQIMNMRRIYHDAAEVVAWLGDDNSRTYKAMRDIQQGIPPEFVDLVTEPQFGQNLDTPSTEVKEIIEGIKEVFDRDYWDRVWILQELAVSHKRRLVCGKGELDWKNLVQFATIVASVENPNRYFREVRTAVTRTQPVWLLSLLYGDENWRQTLDLAKLVYLSKYAEASEMKDHIVAIQSMVTAGGGVPIDGSGSDCSVICRAIRQILQDMRYTRRWTQEVVTYCEQLASECPHNPLSKDQDSRMARWYCSQAECGSLRTCIRIATVLYEHETLYSSVLGTKTVHYALTGLWGVRG
jgi:hypothetical protein